MGFIVRSDSVTSSKLLMDFEAGGSAFTLNI